MINYKGLFYNEDTQKHFYEGGAHFMYKQLVRELEDLKSKREKEENEKIFQSRNKSIDYKEKESSQKQKNNILDLDNYNIYESPIKKRKNNKSYFEQLLSIDKIRNKKKSIKLKEIKSMERKKDNILNNENNRYNKISHIKNNSLDLNLQNDDNNNKNKVLLTEENQNFKSKKIFNIKIFSDLNNKSHKNMKELISLPKIESSYFNNLSKELNENYSNSNSNLPTKSTNIKSDFSHPKTKLEFEINKDLNKNDNKRSEYLFFSFKNNLPKLNGQSLSNVNDNKSIMNNLDKNRQLFTINKEDRIKDSLENNNNFKCINLKKNRIKIMKLSEGKNKQNDIKSKLFSQHIKKSHRKKLLKESSSNDDEE